MNIDQRMSTHEIVKDQLIKQGRKKTWLSQQMGMSRPTLDERLKENCWLPGEILKLKQLGILRA